MQNQRCISSGQERIKDASKGLFYMSESDYPFEPVSLDNSLPSLLEKRLIELSGKPIGAKVEKVTLQHFFRNMTKVSPSATADQTQTIQQFQALQEVFQEELQDITVYLIGEVEIDAFLIGKSADGLYTGLRTKVIQT